MQLMFDGTGKKGFRHVEEKILCEWGLKFFFFFFFSNAKTSIHIFRNVSPLKAYSRMVFVCFLKQQQPQQPNQNKTVNKTKKTPILPNCKTITKITNISLSCLLS